MKKELCIYIDVDETFIRNIGTKQIPIPNTINHIKYLKKQGAVLYCWSSGGAIYAKEKAKEFGVEHCFVGFLPKPKVMIDDVKFSEWRHLLQIHPNECTSHSIETYWSQLK